jgi:hypothetical protein
MAFGKLIDKAKETASKAKEVSLDTASRAKEATLDTASRAKEATLETAGRAKELSLDTATRVKDSTTRIVSVGREQVRERLLSFLSEINGLKPILAECGFAVGDVSVGVSLPPEFRVVVEQIEEGENSVEHILEENEDTITKTQKTILTSLLRANRLAQRTDKYGYCVRQYELLMSIPPKVTAVFKPKVDVCEILEDDLEAFVVEDYNHLDSQTHL